MSEEKVGYYIAIETGCCGSNYTEHNISDITEEELASMTPEVRENFLKVMKSMENK